MFIVISGCAAPAALLQKEADGYQLQRHTLQGHPFTHIAYTKNLQDKNQRLHVYIEGDGTPWIARFIVAKDPTPRTSIVFKLLNQDPQPSLYLGRPCYLGQANSPHCQPIFWTHKRHGPEVIESMTNALQRFLHEHPADELVFIGHSGGGAIAMLLAQHFPQTYAIVTLAGNLDIDAWTNHHGYTPLHGSLNPASLPPYAAHIRQIHLIAEEDRVVPPQIIKTALSNQPHSEIINVENVTHTCCWQEVWPDILKKLAH